MGRVGELWLFAFMLNIFLQNTCNLKFIFQEVQKFKKESNFYWIFSWVGFNLFKATENHFEKTV